MKPGVDISDAVIYELREIILESQRYEKEYVLKGRLYYDSDRYGSTVLTVIDGNIKMASISSTGDLYTITVGVHHPLVGDSNASTVGRKTS